MKVELIREVNPETVEAAKIARSLILRGLMWLQDKQEVNQHILTIYLDDPYEPTYVQMYWEKDIAHITLEHLNFGVLGYIRFDGMKTIGITEAMQLEGRILDAIQKHGGQMK